MLEDEYLLDYFRDKGLERRICTSCGSAFWTRDPERTLCGDAPCEPYNFIGDPVFRPHTLSTMREAFLSFFERNGHARINQYGEAAKDTSLLVEANRSNLDYPIGLRRKPRRLEIECDQFHNASAQATVARWA